MPPSPVQDLRRAGLRAIVVGGSAGGIDALRTILPSLPASLSVPVVVVLHIGAESKCEWASVFSRCKVPVGEAEDKETARPGAVTVAPPGYHLLVDRAGVLSLSVDEPVNLSRPSIDVLFESASWAYGDGLLAILLSGANADGAAGMGAVHRAGGMCWVQAPDEAFMATMPKAAILAVPQARVLSLGQMSEAFEALNPIEGR